MTQTNPHEVELANPPEATLANDYERYAVYYAPAPDSELAAFGRDWLGVDPETGKVSPAPNRFVESPRKYGFHATLKAPMRLASGASIDDLCDGVADLCFALRAVDLGQLKLKAIGPFLALATDSELHEPVSELAFKCVTALDHLRAPLNDKERNKRKKLSDNQTAHLENWGYPYVGDEFRFHMTLSSALPDDDRDQAYETLKALVPQTRTQLDSICIFGDPGGSASFRLIERFYLRG